MLVLTVAPQGRWCWTCCEGVCAERQRCSVRVRYYFKPGELSLRTRRLGLVFLTFTTFCLSWFVVILEPFRLRAIGRVSVLINIWLREPCWKAKGHMKEGGHHLQLICHHKYAHVGKVISSVYITSSVQFKVCLCSCNLHSFWRGWGGCRVRVGYRLPLGFL